MQAVQMVEQRFGPPKTPEQLAKQQQNNSLAQTGGTITGLLIGREAMGGFKNVKDLLGMGAKTTDASVATPKLLGANTVNLGGQTGAGAVEMPTALGGAEALGQSGWALEGIGSAGNYYLPIAGAVGMTDLLANQRTGRRGYLQGAASGAAMGSYFGPWGAAIGGAIGLGAAGANEMFDTNKFKTEGNRFQKLRDQGINLPGVQEAETLRQGRSKQQLIDIEKAKIAQGKYGNVKFAESRNEADLKPEDIWGYAAFYEKYGNDWLGKFNEKKRREIAQKALDAGAVREHHGTIDIDWNKVDAPQAQTAQPTQSQGKQSIRDVLKNNMKKA